jgi:hypothetical protein
MRRTANSELVRTSLKHEKTLTPTFFGKHNNRVQPD